MDRIFLQDILPLDKLATKGAILLVRHFYDKLAEMEEKNLIEEYQGFQIKPAFRNCKYIISFLAEPNNQARFYGIFEKVGLKEKENLPNCSKKLAQYYQIDEEKRTNYFFIKQKRRTEYIKFENRIIIDWTVPRGWYNTYGKVKSKEVIKILPFNYVKDFPGLMNIKLEFNELKKIIENPESHIDWLESLTKLQAIYLILHKTTGHQYIGTTYGENGLWQRWEKYIKGDHTGGNKEFVNLKNEDPKFYKSFQFSILEVLSKTANQKYCTAKESNWKEKLGSKAFGLNKN